MAYTSPASDQQIFAEWDQAYSPDVVKALGVPLAGPQADLKARYFATPAWRIQALWKKWVVAKHFGDLDFFTQTKLVAEGALDTVTGAAGTLVDEVKDEAGNVLHKADDFRRWLGDKANDIFSQAAGMSPESILAAIKADFSKFLSFIERPLQEKFSTITHDGKAYAWEEARKKPETAIWYIAAAAHDQGTVVRDSLLAEINTLKLDGDERIEPDGLNLIDPITITIIVVAIIILAAVLIKHFTPPNTIANQIATKVLDVGGAVVGMLTGGRITSIPGDDSGKDSGGGTGSGSGTGTGSGSGTGSGTGSGGDGSKQGVTAGHSSPMVTILIIVALAYVALNWDDFDFDY